MIPPGWGVVGSALCAALLASLFACASPDRAQPTGDGGLRTVRESHGDTMVVRTIGIGFDSARVRLVQEVSIGKQDGPVNEVLTEIRRVRPTADGGVILTDGNRPAAVQVKRFDSAANFVRNIGRIGVGPGEYTFPNGIAVAPRGELLVWGRNGISVYGPDGAFKDTLPVPSTAGQFVDSLGRVYTETTKDDPELPDSIVMGRRAQRNIAVRILLDGTAQDTVVSPRSASAPRTAVPLNSGSFVNVIAIPYVPQFFTTLSPLGYYVAGQGGRFELLLKSPQGKPMRIESDRAAVAIDPEERGAEYDRIRARTAAIAPSDIALSKPFFKYLRVDDDGRIWVWLHQPSVRTIAADTIKAAAAGTGKYFWSEPVSVYDVFAPGGDFLGSVRLPERASFAAAKGDKLWLVITDELDVPRVVRYRIEGFRSR